MARKGQFKKGGGRVGHHSGGSKKRSKSRAMTHHPRTVQTRTVYRAAPKKHHKRKHHAAVGGVKLGHLAIAAAGLAYVTSDKNGIAAVKEYGAKIPGAATFGTPAAIGLACLAVDRFVKKNKWLKLVGYAGLVLAATKLGTDGTDFKFVGDADVGDYDMSDVGDIDD